ncbi:MAG: SAM-dependent methyltransferase [Aliihoeflea sp.]|uniref:SAM-dependent methyltransferase n=1 Tax=Aliihoeflea sp. TaxID=2608088 RepID=UPI004034DE84
MNMPVAISDASDIAAVVERARALLDDGDVIAARMLAAGAYDQAKAAGGFAERFGAAERLVDKARRLQGDALLIESRAKIRIADEYDAAQERGEVGQRTGRPKKVVAVDDDIPPPRAEDVGFSRHEIHDARKLRDAERVTPGIVERAIQARLEAGLEPSRASLRNNIGTKTATREERGDNFYETPLEATRALLALESFHLEIWEPACGKGAISRILEDAGYEVFLSDLVDRETADRHGAVQHVGDFRQIDRDGAAAIGMDRPCDIVTNPPYGEALNSFIAHALRAHRPRKMALLLNLNFLCGFEDPERCFAMDENPPARVHVFTRRLPMMHRDGWDGPKAQSSMNTAWFVWEADATGAYRGPTIVNRVDWKTLQDVPLREPGERASTAADNGPLVWIDEPGRKLAVAGDVEIGAIFSHGNRLEWRMFIGPDATVGPSQKAKNEGAAKLALTAKWRQFLARAGLP